MLYDVAFLGICTNTYPPLWVGTSEKHLLSALEGLTHASGAVFISREESPRMRVEDAWKDLGTDTQRLTNTTLNVCLAPLSVCCVHLNTCHIACPSRDGNKEILKGIQVCDRLINKSVVVNRKNGKRYWWEVNLLDNFAIHYDGWNTQFVSP